MSSSHELTDDDDSFSLNDDSGDTIPYYDNKDVIVLSSDDDADTSKESPNKSANHNYGSVNERRRQVIKNLFPIAIKKEEVIVKDEKCVPSTSVTAPPIPKEPGFEKMIGGVKVVLPVNPYGSQIALMSKVITAMTKGQNCLLESPTGSGKTLALLCAALAWQQCEQDRMGQQKAQSYFSSYPELMNVEGAKEYIASPPAKNGMTPEKMDQFFRRPIFGEKSIYDKPAQNGSDASNKRQEPLEDSFEDGNLVKIHKKRRLDGMDTGDSLPSSPKRSVYSTPEKQDVPLIPETPPNVRDLYNLLNALQLRTSLLVRCSLPTIYYGARTHKQLQQVVKEFRRTVYCGVAKMTILSSREYSCIREFDPKWKTKNDMCRGCVKTVKSEKSKNSETNCSYYDNRAALGHHSLPPAFDLEDLVSTGNEMRACPYYAARHMMASAHIVFCPYNYLIDPAIRKSMQVSLTDNVVIIDEGHNIEDICRSAATFVCTRDNLRMSILELEKVADSRYTVNEDVIALVKILRCWDDWFTHQIPLLDKQPMKNDETEYLWPEAKHFVQTLNNHNIGQAHYHEFHNSAESFCRRLREDPRTLVGIAQATGTLVEELDTILGYLFRDAGKYMDDFKPVLIRSTIVTSSQNDSNSWRSQFTQGEKKEVLSLKLMCMNPALVFEGLKTAKCIILASGTLTPLVSLYSELATEFPLKISPNHVIPQDRVWIGSLSTCPQGRRLECKSVSTNQVETQDALGEAVLWVCAVTPNGVLCFLPSYQVINKLIKRWRETGVWKKLSSAKHVFIENRNVKDHNDIMDDYYKYASSEKGALLIAVYRGKVSEGMDFKDEQARAVIAIGIPYPNTFDMAVKEKMNYNDKYARERKLLPSSEWLRVQAYRALNQAVGRCVRHRNDWGAVLLVDARFQQDYYTEHLSGWVRKFLGNNHHTFESLVNSVNSLETFMQMRLNEEDHEMAR